MPWTQTDTSFKKLSNKRITTSTGKGLPEEKGASTLELYLPDIKTGTIPGTPPNATTDVLYYTGSIGQTLAVDTSVPGNLTWFATSGYGNTTAANDGSALSESQRLGSWISDKYDAFGTVSGAGYEIKVYDKNDNLITKSDNSNWLFDYQTGILVFNNNVNSYGTGISTNGPYRIVGHRYIGPQGIIPASYGGLGYTSYTLGDLFVGAGSTIIKFPLGSNNQVLKIDTSSSTGLTWGTAASAAISSLNGLTDSTQTFSVGTSGTFFNISSVGSSHTFNIPIAGTGSTGLITTLAQSFAGVKTFTNDLIISSSTVSTSTSTGALTVTGGVGIGGSLFLSSSVPSSLSGVVVNSGVITAGSWAGNTITAYYGGTGYNSYTKGDILVGAGNTFIKLNVGTDNYVLTASSSSATGLTWLPTAATGLTTLNGLSAGIQYLQFGYSGTVPIFSSSGSTHTLNIPLAGSGSTGLISTEAQTISGQKTFTSAIIGDLTGTATTAGFASTANYAHQSGYATTSGFATTASYSYQSGYGLTSGFATTASYSYQAGYGITAGFATTSSYSYQSGYGITSGFATTASYSYQSGYGITAGFATTASNINIVNATSNLAHPIIFGSTAVGSGVAVSSNTTISFNPSSFILSTSGLAVTSSAVSTSSSTGSLIVSGGVGIGGSLYVTSSLPSSLSGVVVNNGVITSGSWAGSIITGFYGGTGYNSYTKGDILVGAGNTFIKLSVGTDNFVLIADNTTPTGVKWSSVAGLSITSVNGLTASAQFFSTGTTGTGFNISSSGSTHTFNIPIAGTGATGLVSTLAQSFAGTKTFTGDVVVSSTTGSTAFNTGSLTVYGGLGVSGQLSFNQAALGYTGATNPTMAFIGSTTSAPITLTVLSDNSLLWEGTSGKLFGINNNLSSGWIFNVGDISGLPIIRANADGTIAMAEFAANVGIGLSNPSYKLHVVGDTNLSSGYVYRINGTQVLSATSLGIGITNSSLTAVGTITTGTWSATAITSYYGGTGFQTYSTGDLLVGAGSTLTKVSVGTNNYALIADSTVPGGVKWASISGFAITNINGLTASKQDLAFGYSGTVPAFSSSGSTHTLNIPLAGTGSTGLVSTQAQSFAGIKTFTNAVNITDNTGSGSYTSGALVVTGGVGIGGTLNVQGDLNVQGTFTTINSTTITVADKNIELGVVASPSDLTAQGGGITLRGGTDKSINWYSGVGWSSSESWNLASGNTYKINGGIVLSATSLGTGVTNSNLTALGTITTGTWSATAITALYGGTGLVPSFTVGDILYANTSSTWGRLTANSNAGYVLTSAGSGATPTYVAQSTLLVGLASTSSYSYQSGYAITSGIATTAINLNVIAASTNTNHYILFTPTSGSASGVAVSSDAGLLFNPASNTLTTNTFSAGVSVNTVTGSVIGSTASISPTTGALVVTGGVGIGGSLYVASATAISGVTINNGIITGNLSGTATTATTSGFATTSANINVANAASGTFFPVLSNTASSTSGIGASVNNFFSFNAATGAFGATSVNILADQSYSVGGNSVISATSLGTGVTNSSLTAVGTLRTGTWAGTVITSYYGGTGYNSYTKGDILVGAGNTFIKLSVGTDNYVLTASSSSATGLTWSPTAATGITTINSLTATQQYFATGTTGTGFNISSSGSTHTFNIPIAGTGATGLVSTLAQTFTGAKTFDTTLTVSATTPSTSYSSGALIVAGGAGFAGTIYTQTDVNVGNSTTGRLFFSQATMGSAGTTVIPSMAFIGATNSPITLSVLADNSLSFDGSSGQLFSINNNLSSGWIFAVNDISGLPLLRANADGTVAMGEFAGNIGIGLSNPSYKLHVVGDTNLSSGYVYRINGTQVLSATSLGTGVTNSSLTAVGTISTGVWAATAITAYYGGTGYNSYTTGDLLVGAGNTFIKLNSGNSNYVLTSNGAGTTPSWQAIPAAAASSVAVSPTTLNQSFFITAVSSSSGTGFGLSTITSFVVNPSSGVVSVSGLAVTSTTVSTSTSTGALTITGGVGIGGSLFTGTSTPNSISGVVLSNGVVTSGSWSATAITARYGGTGNTAYTLGDLLVGAGSTFIKLPVGINSYVLGSDSTKPAGIGWTTVTPLTVSDSPPSSPKNADLWFNSSDGGLLVYYNDVDTAQWVEIALGSGIDLSQPVHITNATPSTSTSTGALIVDGGAGIAGTVFASSFSVNGVYDQISSTLITSATTANQVALTLDASSFRTAKMIVQVTSGSNYHSQEILMVHDGSEVYMTEYAMVNTGAIGSTFNGDISGGNMRFLVSPTNAVTTYKIACTAIRI